MERLLLHLSLLWGLATTLPAATTINAANKYAYGANFGWMDWRGTTLILSLESAPESALINPFPNTSPKICKPESL